MDRVDMHLRYLPIAGRYDMHDPLECEDDDRSCRRVKVAQSALNAMKATEAMSQAVFRMAEHLYTFGEL